MELNQKQLKNLYSELDFEENEEIMYATYHKEMDTFYIDYIDHNTGCVSRYEAYIPEKERVRNILK